MTAVKKNRVSDLSFQSRWRIKPCLSILVLAALLCLQFSQNTLAVPLFNFVHLPPVNILANQPENTQIPANIVDFVIQDLSRRTGIDASDFKLTQASRQTWPDGCLGLAKADEMCTQSLVEGWRVIISHNGKNWTYRTDGRGRTVRLESQN